jgi:hypothetical protein
MSIKEKYSVRSIDNEQCKEWLLYKHYAKTIPNIMYAFGLYEYKILKGICCFGTPANNHNNQLGDFKQIELVRLVKNDNLEKNAASFLIAECFKLLPKPLSLISYADIGKNHHGYIYQATNWLYTGVGGGVDFYIDEKQNEIHSRIMSDYRKKYSKMTRDEIQKMLNWKKEKGTYKHRYFYFLGTKKEKILWLKFLTDKYKIENYPKGDNKNYDASYKPTVQISLF